MCSSSSSSSSNKNALAKKLTFDHPTLPEEETGDEAQMSNSQMSFTASEASSSGTNTTQKERKTASAVNKIVKSLQSQTSDDSRMSLSSRYQGYRLDFLWFAFPYCLLYYYEILKQAKLQCAVLVSLELFSR